MTRFLLAILAFALTACSAAATAPTLPVAKQKRCLLLTTNDSEANFDGPRAGSLTAPTYAGSIARIAAEKQRLLAERAGGVLLVEGGDVLQGRYMERRDGDKARAMRDALGVYEAAGYDFGTIGNHEFDNGPKLLRSALQGLTRYRLLSANLDATGTSLDPTQDGKTQALFGSTAVADCGGVRVGLLGLTTPTTRTISQIGDVRFPADPIAGPARQAVADLRRAGAQVIVVLSHLGVGEDVQLAKDVTGIDAIVGGHSHTELPVAQRVGPTWITQAGSRFSHLGYLDLVLAADGRGLDAQATTWQMRPVNADLPEDPALRSRIDQLRGELVAEVVIGQRTVAWNLMEPRGIYGVRASRAMTAVAQRALPTERMDGALLNVGGLRSQTLYPPGPVTNLEVQAIHPFINRLVVITLTGQQLLDVLEHSCTPGSDGHGQTLTFWQISATCDKSKPAPQYRIVDGRPVEILQRGQRVRDATVGGQPIEAGRRYTVATIDYLAKGGSGYLPLAQGERRCLDGKPFGVEPPCKSPLMHEAIADEVKNGGMDAGLPGAILP